MTLKSDAPIVQVQNALALGAAGAFGALFAVQAEGQARMSVWLQYTLASATGAPVIRARWFPLGAGNVPVAPAQCTGVIISGTNLVAEEWTLANPGGLIAGNSYSRVVVFQVPPSSTSAEFQIAEIGDTANPGTVSCWVGFQAEGSD